jgi:hypothetical protein
MFSTVALAAALAPATSFGLDVHPETAVGYRYADVAIEDEVVDANLRGLFLEGGLRF